MFQTRSEETGLANWDSLEDAINAAEKDATIWKISFTLQNTGERIRLVLKDEGWTYEPIELPSEQLKEVD